jgi:hypothetical protein
LHNHKENLIAKEPAISTAEFYYGLELNAIENLAVINRSTKSGLN